MRIDEILASIPSPPVGVWYIGPVPIRAYAIAILIGIVAAVLILDRRYVKKGGPQDTALDVAVWAVVCGIIGARIYYVISTPDQYFGVNGDPLAVFRIWEGGLAIFGSLIGGTIGIAIALHRRGLRFAPFVDALAPGLLIAQAIGRCGNYFNQELFGTPTDLPWALEIDDQHLPSGYASGTTFHPTFLYEQLWNLSGFLVLLFLERKFKLRGGKVAASYFVIYGIGRFLIESIRTDFAHSIGGLRVNQWTALIAVLVGVLFLVTLHFAVKAHPEIDDIYFAAKPKSKLKLNDSDTSHAQDSYHKESECTISGKLEQSKL